MNPENGNPNPPRGVDNKPKGGEKTEEERKPKEGELTPSVEGQKSTEDKIVQTIFSSEELDSFATTESSSSEDEDEEFGEACKLGKVAWIVSRRFCKHTRLTKCPCMNSMRVQGSKPKYHFDEQSLNDLAAIAMELRLRSFSFRAGVFDALDHYRDHHVTKIACTTRNSNISCDPRMDRSRFLSYVWELREAYLPITREQAEGKFGKEQCFESQDGPGFLRSLFDGLQALMSKTGKTVGGIVTAVFKKFISWIQTVVDVISESLATLLDKFFQFIMDKFIASFDSLTFIKTALEDNKANTALVLISFLIVVVVIDVLGILAYKLVQKVVDMLFSRYCGLEAQSPADAHPIYAIVSILGVMLGLTACEFSIVAKRCREFTSIVMASITGTLVIGSLFVLLPIALQSALSAKFATQQQKDELVVEDWMVRSTTVLRLKKIPRVLASEEYYEWCSDLVKGIPDVRTKIKTPIVVQAYLRNLAGLMEVITTLEGFKDSKSERDYPFSIHLAAPPGVGKSLITGRFARDLFDVSTSEIYPRPFASEFWDAFLPNAKVITFDEFLVGETLVQQRAAKEYLEVVSTKKFTPPLASVDSPTVGLKGTNCAPIGVITVNNKAYTTISCYDDSTLNRRRKAVLEMKVKPKYVHLFVDNEMKLDGLSDKELSELAWLEFRFVPRTARSNAPIPYQSYDQVLLTLKQMLKNHQNVCSRIREHLQHGSLDEDTPAQLFESLLKEMRGIPKKETTPMDEIFNLLTGAKDTCMSFFAQSPGSDDPSDVTFIDIPETTDLPPSSPQMDDRELKLMELRKRTKPGTMMRKALNCLKVYRDPRKSKEKKQKAMDDFHAHLRCSVPEDYTDVARTHFEDDLRDLQNLQFLKEIEDSGSEYDSAEEIPQLEILAQIDHSNVDPTQRHIHKCHGVGLRPKMKIVTDTRRLDDAISDAAENFMPATKEVPLLDAYGHPIYHTVFCNNRFVHKHEDSKVHRMLCNTCVSNNWTESKSGYFDYKVNLQFVHPPTYTEELPSQREYDIELRTPEEEKTIKEELNRIALAKFLQFGTLPIVWFDSEQYDLGSEFAGYIEASPYDAAMATIRSTAKWVAIFSSAYIVLKSIRTFFHKEEDSLISQSLPSNRQNTPKARARTFQRGVAQSGTTLRFQLGDELMHNAIPVEGNTFLTYYHSLLRDGERVEDGVLTLHWNGAVYRTNFAWERVVALPTEDIAFITVDAPKKPQFPNMRKKFWTEDEFLSFTSSAAYVECDQRKFVVATKKHGVSYANGNSRTELADALIYLHETKKGDCGIAITSAQVFPGKILGMHVAGGMYGPSKSGVATVVTRDMVDEALKPQDFGSYNFTSEGPADFNAPYPNLAYKRTIPISDQIHVPRRSVLRKSIIQEVTGIETNKCKPVMSANDYRSNGRDPLIAMITDTLEVTHKEVNSDLVEEIGDSLIANLKRNLKWPIGRRHLTFEEALQGVPMHLASMKTNTSAGYPLCKTTNKPGKKEFFQFTPNGGLAYDPEFRKMVEDFKEKFSMGLIDERRFVAYLKDELVSPEKSAKGLCRIIYGGDLISNVVYRMLFGSLLAAINGSYSTTSSAIGLNQYSHDMQSIYDYLRPVGNNFVAGDFKNFDKTTNPALLEQAYRILMELAGDLATPTEKMSFVKQQRFSPAQVDDHLIYFVNTHFSGCFFTSPINNIVNELALRYCFATIKPGLIFEDHVRLKVLGDDHIYNFSDEGRLTPFEIRDVMSEIGFTYTSDRKNEPLVNEFRKFEDVTFLGAHPVLVRGQYCGALKKSTLEETILWTRNKNQTIVQEVKMVMELSSIWGPEYYKETCNYLNEALYLSGMETIIMPSCREMQRVVASRTVTSEHNYPYGLFAQGPPDNSLAKLNEGKLTVAGMQGMRQPSSLAGKAVNEESMDMNFGTESFVYRADITWTNTDTPGIPIFGVDVPFGLLDLGNPDNVQNMPFDRFSYFEGDVEIEAQLNATPFVQGILAMNFMPLETYQTELANITASENVLMHPDNSGSYRLKIPFRYFRSLMNTNTRGLPEQESLGRLYVTPITALKASETVSTTITIYSRFPDSKFTIPRPLPATSRFDTITTFGKHITGVDEVALEGTEMVQNYQFEAQGNTSSTSINNTYTVAGDMPIQGPISQTGSSAATQDISPDVSIPMPLDNPPLCSGAIPVEQSFPGFASSHGVRPTRDLQLKPAALARQHMAIFGPEETKIQNLLSKRCLLTTVNLNTTQVPGTELLLLRLDTRLGMAAGFGIPLNIVLLNHFFFWRSDIELEFVAASTKFHSTRLGAVVAYAAPGLAAGSRTVNYSSMMNFAAGENGVNRTHKMVIPFNAQTEFLRTYEGDLTRDPIQNYAIGTMGLYVQNQLRAPETVAQNIDIAVFIRFVNSKVAVPRGVTEWSFGKNSTPFPTLGYTLKKYLAGRVTGGTLLPLTAGESRSTQIVSYRRKKYITVLTANLDWFGDIPAGNVTVLAASTPSINIVTLVWKSSASVTIQEDQVTILRIGVSGITTFLSFKEEINYPSGVSYADSYVLFDCGGGYMRWMAGNLNPPMAIEEEFVGEAQGPGDIEQIEEVNQDGDGENLQEIQTSTVTKTEAPVRSNIPCSLELGEKFEFCVTDLIEVDRRYRKRNVYVNDNVNGLRVWTSSAQSSNNFRTVTHFNNRPASEFMLLFAAWAGSVKYRILCPNGSANPEIVYQPYYNPTGQNMGRIPVDAAFSGAYIDDTSSAATNDAYFMDSTVQGPMALEVAYPVSKTGYVDVSAPFQTHFNFVFTQVNDSLQSLPIDCGTMTLSKTTSPDQTISDFTVWTALGDDARYGIFRPPQLSSFQPISAMTGVGGFRQS